MRSSLSYVILIVVIRHSMTGNWLDYCPRSRRLQGGSWQASSRIAVTRTQLHDPLIFEESAFFLQLRLSGPFGTVTSVKRGIVFL